MNARDKVPEQLQENLLGRAGPAVKFDPGKHPRNRLGRFSEVLGQLAQAGGKVELPNGTTVRPGRLGGLEVRNRKGKTIARTDVPAVAAAHALSIFDDARVKSGTNPDLIHNARTAELEAARRQAVVAGSMAGIESVEGLQRSLKKSRSERMPPFHEPNVVGRSPETRTSRLALRARNRPPGHPLFGVKHPRREAVLATIKQELSDTHELRPVASPPDVQKYGPGHPRPGMAALERAGGLVVGGTANEPTGDKHARKLERRNEAVNVLGDAVTAAFRGDAVPEHPHGKKHHGKGKRAKHGGKKVKHADDVLAGIRAAVAPA